MEAVGRWWMGKKANLADSVTSISCGLAMTLLGMLTEGLILSAYIYIHTNYHLVS